ncbi:two-component system sensor kinase [Salmonella enterica subsp. enterica]|uniref:Two-component system sensor kinase n=1 Tax=Salmonella enterica I TaxID=59201 RepID=A0A379WQM8_SALET|nr:two-component system sensor kinase [Salmonella enterica subsp. enterica]
MKVWRPGITGKLFLAIFATCIVLLISMHWAVRVSFERGFIDYIKHRQRAAATNAGRCAGRPVPATRQLAFFT